MYSAHLPRKVGSAGRFTVTHTHTEHTDRTHTHTHTHTHHTTHTHTQHTQHTTHTHARNTHTPHTTHIHHTHHTHARRHTHTHQPGEQESCPKESPHHVPSQQVQRVQRQMIPGVDADGDLKKKKIKKIFSHETQRNKKQRELTALDTETSHARQEPLQQKLKLPTASPQLAFESIQPT